MNNSYLLSLQNGINDFSSTDELNTAFVLSNTTPKASLHTLSSIVGMVGGKEESQSFSPEMLSTDKSVALPLPTTNNKDIKTLIGEAQESLTALEAFYQQSPDDYSKKYSLYHSLLAYGSRIGYGNQAKQGVSLFDTNRVLGAIVACQSITDEPKYLLLKGAFSGIQNFLYSNIETQEVGDAADLAKKLRGRSFFVEIATSFIAEQLVEVCQVEMANIIFTGGGHFNLLLPNTNEIKDFIQHFINKANDFFLDNVGLRLSIVYAIEECDQDVFSNFSPYYTSVNDKLESRKQKKYLNSLEKVFAGKSGSIKFVDDEKLGEKMPYASYLIEITPKSAEWSASMKEELVISSFRFLNKHFLILKNKENLSEIRNYLFENADHIQSAKIIALNNTQIIKEIKSFEPLSFPVAFGFKFIGNHTPKQNKKNIQVATFEDIAGMGQNDERLTYKQLGVMRMDVDDLGAIFAFGLEDANGKTSFQRMASLSREFSIFFSGYFNELARKHNIYITYSGGDDAFVIGSWLNTMEFAKDLKHEFDLFTCNNNNVLFSAGIFICNEHYPVVRMAKDAALLEKASKEYGTKNDTEIGKNAISIFNHTLTWDRYDSKMKFVKKLESVVQSDNTTEESSREKQKIRRSFVQRLLNIIQNSTDDYKFYKNLSFFYNLLARHGFTQKNLDTKYKGTNIGEVLESILTDFNDKSNFKDYTIPIHYILYKTRKEKN